MIRIEIDHPEGLYSIGEGLIETYEHSGRKLISDDFFMNEPASVRISMAMDAWLASRLESEFVQVGKGLWFKHPVRAYIKNPESGLWDLVLTGLIDLAGCRQEPFARRMEITIYDYTALLTELDMPVRVYYPWHPSTGNDFTRFIVNYKLPGEEDLPEPEEGEEYAQFFPYPHTVELDNRQVKSLLKVLTDIWKEYFEDLWPLEILHAYLAGETEDDDGWVQNYVVRMDGDDSFYRSFVLGLAQAAWTGYQADSTPGKAFYVNYGFLESSERGCLYAEFGIYPTVICDAFLVMRAGYNHDEGYKEYWRLFAFKDGKQVLDTGQRSRASGGARDPLAVGDCTISPADTIDLGGGAGYRCSDYDLTTLPGAFTNWMDYLYGLTYFVYFNGYIGVAEEWSDGDPVRLGAGDSFHDIFVGQVVNNMYQQYILLTAMNRMFWANYGLIPVSQIMQIYNEFGLLPEVDADAFFVLRAGCVYGGSGAKDHDHDHYEPWDPWTQDDGEGGGGGGGGGTQPPNWRENWRLFALKAGRVVRDWGMRQRNGIGVKNGTTVGSFSLGTGWQLDLQENSYYHATQNEMYSITGNILAYFGAKNYELRYVGPLEAPPGWLANRIFRMKGRPGEPGGEQYQQMALKDWFKLMFFIGDISCYADQRGVVILAGRIPAGELQPPWGSLLDARKELLVYQPWDEEKLGEVLNDVAEIRYLTDYYGGSKAITHRLELEFAKRGWESEPKLRQKIQLGGSNFNFTAFLGSGWYMITEIGHIGQNTLVLRGIRVGEEKDQR